jgi:aspartyl-tRNA(Asn)/glutamyl-tRNA(Gln) amidotransferase subunit A
MDERDSTSLSCPPVPPTSAAGSGSGLKGKRVGIPLEYYVKELHPETVRLWQRGAQQLQDAGAEVVEVSLPATRHALPAYYVLAPAEATSNLSRYDGVRFGKR